MRALDQVRGFEPRREGAFLAYLRQILLNQVRDEVRRARKMPRCEPLSEEHPHDGWSPLEEVIGGGTLKAYEVALAKLPAEHREAVVLRIELGFTHQQVAEAVGSPSANAARMLVVRALVRLAELMDERV